MPRTIPWFVPGVTMRMTSAWILLCWLGWTSLQSLAQDTHAPASGGATLQVDLKGAKAGRWTMDFDAAKALAKERDLAVLLCFTGSDWCPYCKAVAAKVLVKPEWMDYTSNRFALVYLDFPTNAALVPAEYRARNETLQRRMGVQGFPSFVVLDSDGEKVLGAFGATRDTDLLSFMRQATATIRTRDRVLDALLKGLPPPKAKEYRGLLSQYATAQLALKEWLAAKPVRNEENTRIFNTFQEKIDRLNEVVESIESEKILAGLAGPAAAERKDLLRLSEARLRLLTELEEAHGDLKDWMLSRPENTETNRSTFRMMVRRLEEIQGRWHENE